MANSLTYTDGSVKESVLNLISVINPDENRLLNSLQRSTALGPVHQFLKQTLSAVDSTNAGYVEGSDAGAATTTDPVRLTNYTQIFRRVWGVSETQKAAEHYAKDVTPRAMDEAMEVIGNDIEFALVRGTAAAAGSTSTSRTLKGVKSWITTNLVAGAGATYTEAILNNHLSLSWAQGGRVDTILVNGPMKQRIDSFTAGNTREVQAGDQKLVNTVNVYESSFGIVKVFLHRYVSSTAFGDTNNDILYLDSKRWGIAVLRDPKNIDLAKTGSSQKGMFEGELTLEARNEVSSVLAKNYV